MTAAAANVAANLQACCLADGTLNAHCVVRVLTTFGCWPPRDVDEPRTPAEREAFFVDIGRPPDRLGWNAPADDPDAHLGAFKP